MQVLLDSIVQVKKDLELKSGDSISIIGFLRVTEINIQHINVLFDNELLDVLKIGEPNEIENITKDSISNFINQKVHIEIRTGNVYCYFETIQDFLNGNRYGVKNELFYIAENDYYSIESDGNDYFIINYIKNIELINLLKSISHSNYTIGNQLKYQFYRMSNSIVEIDIKYTETDLELFSDLDGFKELQNEFSDPIQHKDKKELFINELVNFIETNSSDYLSIIKNWKAILNAYNKSYKLYLAGFSFEKIKTASNEHFQKLLDRIYDSISKVSGYIFGIPIGFILLMNNFDFKGELIFKNLIILLLSILFFVLIKYILIKNIKESIDAIENEITEFLNQISSVATLSSVKDKLEKLQDKSINDQRFKLKIVKGITIAIFSLTIFVFIFIFLDKSLFLM